MSFNAVLFASTFTDANFTTGLGTTGALPSMFRAIDLLGVFLNGIIGGRLARSKRFDLIGFAVLAVMSALGGGIVRDVILTTPPAAILDPYYLSAALAGAAVAFMWRLDSNWSVRAIIIADGLVLGSWAATGALKTLSLGYGVMPAILLGMMTAIGGGMIRDIAAGNVPIVFGGNNLYALPAGIAAIIMVFCYFHNMRPVGMVAATIVAGSLAIGSHWRRWSLPTNQEWTITMTSQQLRELLRKRNASRLSEVNEETAHRDKVVRDYPLPHENPETATISMNDANSLPTDSNNFNEREHK